MFAVRKIHVGLGNDLVEAGFVLDSGPPSPAAGEHYAGAERLLAALLLARRGAERTAAYQPAQGRAAHAIAAVLLGSASGRQLSATRTRIEVPAVEILPGPLRLLFD